MTPPTRPKFLRYAEVCGGFCLFLAVGLVLQSLAHAYHNDFGGNPDEPAHFVTGMFVRDWLLSGDYLHPMAFAVSYYLHYPKLGIGQWPPLLYQILGGWFVAFGASRVSALAFQLVIAATTATVVLLVGRQLISLWAGLLAALLFLASPLVQETSGRMMTEHLATLLALLSVLAFARYVRTTTIRDGILFGVLSAAAILTRGSSWALGMVPGLVILLTWRFDLLRRAGLWLAVIPVAVTGVPWYALTIGMSQGTWEGSAGHRPYWCAHSGSGKFHRCGPRCSASPWRCGSCSVWFRPAHRRDSW
jgi:4-amino-4-deoxy-L-arabinose transferase-like glycosyltransferase